MPQPEQLTANAIVRNLASLARDLDAVVRELREADLKAVQLRHEADLGEARAFVSAEGAVDLRKALAKISAAPQEAEALAAEAVVRYLRNRISALSTRIDVGRSMAAAHRAELALTPYDHST